MNRTVLHMLRATAFDHPESWPDKLPSIMAAHRMTPHSTTGTSPNFAMLGREVRLPCSLIAAPPAESDTLQVPYNVNFRDTIRAAHKRIRQMTNSSAQVQKTYFDARAKAVSLKPGELVWLYWPRPQARQRLKKLTRLWVGPFRILSFQSEVVINIEHIKSGKRQTVHVDRVQPSTSVPQIISAPRPLANTQPANTAPVTRPSDVEHQSSEPVQTVTQTVTRHSGRVCRPPVRYRD